jgi:hypothetical protein
VFLGPPEQASAGCSLWGASAGHGRGMGSRMEQRQHGGDGAAGAGGGSTVETNSKGNISDAN